MSTIKKPRVKWLAVAREYVDQLGTKGTSRELGEHPCAWAQRLALLSIRLSATRAAGERWSAQLASGEPTTIREVRRRAHRARLLRSDASTPATGSRSGRNQSPD